MSNLTPEMINLDKGLNLQLPKIVAPPGSILDTLNYEQVDFQGQKRIEGYSRYDGQVLAAIDEYYVLVFQEVSTDISTGDILITALGNIWGIVVGEEGTDQRVVAIINYNLIPDVGDTVYYLASSPTAGGTLDSITLGKEVDTVDDHYANLLTFNAELRSRVESLPGGIIGLQWFRDRLYAVADMAMVFVEVSGDVPAPNTLVYVDDGNNSEATVLDVVIDGTGDNAVLFLDTLDTTGWYQLGNDIYLSADDSLIGTTSDTSNVDADSIASFFESRTEQQTVDEDDSSSRNFGWRFKHLGWEVLFEEGTNAFGSLPSSNQNIEGIGTQGPTPTTGNSGSPLALVQKVAITGKPTQVNGWKSTNSPTSYQLRPADVSSTDSDAAYADAYIYWGDDDAAATAPGITGSGLVEYPATNTIEVEGV